MRVIVITIRESEQLASHEHGSTIHAYLPTTAGPRELQVALNTISEGRSYISPDIPKEALVNLRGIPELSSALLTLTKRQVEVLRLIALGRTSKQIALGLNLSVKTIESHRTEIKQRLGIYEIAGLVRFAIRTGLITIDE